MSSNSDLSLIESIKNISGTDLKNKIETGVYLYVRNDQGSNLLHLAVEENTDVAVFNLLLKNGLVDLVSSDTHKINETINCFSKAFDYIERKFDKEVATRLFITNPQKLLEC